MKSQRPFKTPFVAVIFLVNFRTIKNGITLNGETNGVFTSERAVARYYVDLLSERLIEEFGDRIFSLLETGHTHVEVAKLLRLELTDIRFEHFAVLTGAVDQTAKAVLLPATRKALATKSWQSIGRKSSTERNAKNGLPNGAPLWSNEEDDLLLQLVKTHFQLPGRTRPGEPDWVLIIERMHARTDFPKRKPHCYPARLHNLRKAKKTP